LLRSAGPAPLARGGRVALILGVLSLLLSTLAAEDRPLPDYEAFIAQVKTHLATDQERQSGYTFIERRTEQKLDGGGRLRDESVNVFEVYPGLPGQDRYRRLIEEHGKPVPPETLARRDRDRQKEVESYARRMSTNSDRQKETRQREKEGQDYRAAIDDLFRVYDLHMVRRELRDGHDTIFFTLMPKAGVKPQTDDGQMMQHFKARAWISESDYELVRVEIEAINDLSFGWGLLARVHKGTTASYQRRKVNNEVWLPAQVTWTASARVLLLKQMRLRGVADYSGYRKFIVDTSTTYTSPPR
jgi:hypothetical protein